MSKDGIDASLGLSFSLEIFKRYRKSGVLQAALPRMPGIRGSCTAFLTLIDGQVVSVYLKDRHGQHYSSDKETLCRLDDEKGPFEWRLIPYPPNAQGFGSGVQHPVPECPPSPSLQNTSVLKVVAPCPWERFSTWTTQQRDALYTVLMAINGMRTLETIKALLQLPPDLVDELVHILLDIDVITISSN